jgi:type IV secretion system protein VirB2
VVASAAIESDKSTMAQAAITADPGQSVFVAASTWIEGLLLGSFGTAVAVLAVALLGYHMLTGQTDLRRAIQVVLGIFILFGAPTLARELASAARGAPADIPHQTETPPPPQAPPAPQMPSAFDPYAGASVPTVN